MHHYPQLIGNLRLQLTRYRKHLVLSIVLVSLTFAMMLQTQPLQSQSSFYGYMPAVKSRIIAEVGAPPCRWTHGGNGFITYIPYQWSNLLQTPDSLYRIAFESSIADWNAVSTKVHFYYPGTFGKITLDTYSLEDGRGGYAQYNCDGSVTSTYLVRANIFYDNINIYSANERRSVTGHELGHSLGIGHIPGRDFISLMGYNPNNDIYYTPQQSDVDLVNRLYP